jgi:hypothetical protein
LTAAAFGEIERVAIVNMVEVRSLSFLKLNMVELSLECILRIAKFASWVLAVVVNG